MDQTAVIRVNRPYNRHFIIGQELALLWTKPGGVLIDFHTSIHQIQVSPTRNNLDQFFYPEYGVTMRTSTPRRAALRISSVKS